MPVRMTSVGSLRQREVVVLAGRVLPLAADRLVGPQPGDFSVLDEALPAAVGCSVPKYFILTEVIVREKINRTERFANSFLGVPLML